MFNLPQKRINTFQGIINYLEDNNENFEIKVRKLYLDDLKSYRAIEKLLNINNRSVKKLLEYYNIPIRKGSDAVKTQWINNDKRRKDISKTFSKYAKGNTKRRLQDIDIINNRLKFGNFKLINCFIDDSFTQRFEVECIYCRNIFRLSASSLDKPHCRSKDDINIKSKGEKLILNYLKERNVNFKKEYCFKDLKIIRYLRFDFAIFNNDQLFCLIEFNGKQHYGINSKYSNDRVYKSDKMKNDYCKKNNIKLITIPFYFINRVDEILNYHITL